MPAAHEVIVRGFVLLILGWLLGCSPTRSATREEPILPSDFSATVERLVQSVSQPESIWPETLPGVATFVHKVKWRSETLYAIALWYTGSGENWKRLAQANPNIKPNQIHFGDTILIPNDLLKTRRVMPAPAKKSPPTPNPASPPQPDRINLYGPIGEDDAPTPDNRETELPIPLETID